MSRRMLLEDDYRENGFEWDYEKKSENPISIKDLCKEYLEGLNINLNTFSNNQILEIDIQNVEAGSNNPQIILLCSKNTGGKVYWGSADGLLGIGNNPNFKLQLNYPTKLRLTLIDNIFSLYVDEILQGSTNVYTNRWLPFTGIQFELVVLNIFATGFRYKNFE